MFGQFDFGEVPFADGFEEAVLADVRLLPGPAGGYAGRGAAITSLETAREKKRNGLIKWDKKPTTSPGYLANECEQFLAQKKFQHSAGEECRVPK